MNHSLQTLFEILIKHLQKGRSPVLDQFQSGIEPQAVDSKIKALSIKIPPEVYSLYNWHNGIAHSEKLTLSQMWIFPMGMFVPIEDSVDRYHYHAGKDGFWQESMFMLFESGGGEMYLIDCDEKSATYRQIFKHDYGAIYYDVIITIYDSLESLFASIVECFEQKAYYFDPSSGSLEADDKLEKEIMKKNNPNSKYWKMHD
jgi:hypothetical protein